LFLSALPGEERTYYLKLALIRGEDFIDGGDYVYHIDRRNPPAPELTGLSGGLRITDPGETSFLSDGSASLRFKAEPGSRIYYSLGGDLTRTLGPWNGEEIRLPESPGGRRIYNLTAYAEDPGGNRSPTLNWVFTVLPEAGPSLEVVSPVPGTFDNPQLLYLRISGSREYQWIRYSLDDSEPALMGALYTGPVVLPAEGPVVLRIAALPKGPANSGPGAAEHYEVRYSVNPGRGGLSLPASGIYAGDLNLTLPGSGYYNYREESPGPGDSRLPLGGPILGIPQGVREFPLRIKTGEGREYRYYYILDNRLPPPPRIEVSDPLPLRDSTRVFLSGPAYARIHYTLDGRSPGITSALYSDPFVLNLPPDSSLGSIIVKAAAFGQNGRVSSEALLLLTYDKAPLEPPQVQIHQSEPLSGAWISVSEPRQGQEIVYSLAAGEALSPVDGDSLIPRGDSPVFSGRQFLDLPEGQSQTFFLRFAARSSSGNLSAPTEVYEIRIDRRHVSPPLIACRDGWVTLHGPSHLYYRLIESPGSPLPEPQSYEGAFLLPLGEGPSRIEVEAWSEDSGGVRSPAARLAVSLPPRIPLPPEYSGVYSGEIAGGPAKVIYFKPLPPEYEIVYSLGLDDQPPPEIGPSSPVAGSRLVLSTEENRETLYRLLLKTRNRITGDYSEEVRLSFTLDRKPPELPALTGPDNGGWYYDSVTLSFPEDYPHRLYLSLGEGEDPPDPFSAGGQRFLGSLEFTALPGKTRTLSYRLGAEDQAGNRTLGSAAIRFTVDNSSPPLPELLGLPESGLAYGEVRIRANPDPGITVRYELGRDGVLPRPLDLNSPILSASGILEIPETRERTVMIRYRTINSMGIWSREEGLVSFTLMAANLDLPPDPRITHLEEGWLMFAWDIPPNLKIFYRAAGEGANFEEFTQPVLFSFDSSPRLNLEFYYRDRIGTAGPLRRFSLAREGGGDLVTGLPPSLISNRRVELRPLSNRRLHYELALGDRPPDQVSLFSPVFPDPLILDLPPGDAGTYGLRVRAYDPEKQELSGAEQLIRFAIDKRPVAPPRLSGIVDGGIYQERVWLHFEEGEVYYFLRSLEPGQEGAGPPPLEDFESYQGPRLLAAPPGERLDYRLWAYGKNSLSSLSELVVWSFRVDQQNLYLSPEGNDENPGTPDKPLQTLRRALAAAEETGRRRLNLARGVYVLNAPLSLPEGFEIEGGLEPGLWAASPGEFSLIRLSPGIRGPGAILPQGSGSLKGLILEGENLGSDSLFRQSRGVQTWEAVELRLTGGRAEGLSLLGGELFLKDCRFTGGPAGPALLSVRGGRVTVSGTTLSRTGTADAGERGDSLVVRLIETEGVFRQSRILAGGGVISRALQGENSILRLLDCDISCGSGSREALGLEIKGGRLLLEDSRISSSGMSSPLVRGLNGAEGEIEIRGSSFLMEALNGALAVQARDSGYLIRDSLFRAQGGEYVYLLRFENSRGRGFNNHLFTGPSGDLQALTVDGGEGEWFHNTFLLNYGNALGLVYRGGRVSFSNNILFALGGPRPGGTAAGVSYEAAGEALSAGFTLRGNAFFGWDQAYRRPAARTRGAANPPAGPAARTAPELNRLDGAAEGGPFDQNREESPAALFAGPAVLVYPFGELPRLRDPAAGVGAGAEG
jgi:hypothetical protein